MQNQKQQVIDLFDKFYNSNSIPEKQQFKSEILTQIKSDVNDVEQILISSLETYLHSSIDLLKINSKKLKYESFTDILTKIYKV